MDEGPQLLPLPPAIETEPISRPSSTSTQTSAQVSATQSIQQSGLPGIAALATASQAANSPQARPVAIAPAMYPQGTSPASTHPGPGGNLVSSIPLPPFRLLSFATFPLPPSHIPTVVTSPASRNAINDVGRRMRKSPLPIGSLASAGRRILVEPGAYLRPCPFVSLSVAGRL
jgi:hypothetical protein